MRSRRVDTGPSVFLCKFHDSAFCKALSRNLLDYYIVLFGDDIELYLHYLASDALTALVTMLQGMVACGTWMSSNLLHLDASKMQPVYIVF